MIDQTLCNILDMPLGYVFATFLMQLLNRTRERNFNQQRQVEQLQYDRETGQRPRTVRRNSHIEKNNFTDFEVEDEQTRDYSFMRTLPLNQKEQANELGQRPRNVQRNSHNKRKNVDNIEIEDEETVDNR